MRDKNWSLFDEEPIVRGYIECALWAPSDAEVEDASPLELDEEAFERLKKDALDFQDANLDMIMRALQFYPAPMGEELEWVGHDLWLTRNGHGAGFWDRDLPKDLGDRLTKAAHDLGEIDLYRGDDGKVYIG